MSATTERLRNSCDQCAHSKIKCDGERPNCRKCCRRDRSCSYSHVRQAGRPRRARPARLDTSNDELTASIRDSAAMASPGQYCPTSASNTSSITPEIAVAPDISDQLEAVLAGKKLHYDGYDGHSNRSRSDVALEDTNLRPGDLMNSSALTQTQYPISTDYLSSFPMEFELSVALDIPAYNQTNEDNSTDYSSSLNLGADPSRARDAPTQNHRNEGISMNMEDSSTVAGHHTPISHLEFDGCHLEHCFRELLDNSRINTIVNHIVNPPLNGKCISCSSQSRDACFHTKVNDKRGAAHLCQCPTLLNRLYVIVMNPRLSQSTKLVPLDLILLLEQALHDTKEAITWCTVCASSRLSSANGITLCLAADWITNCIRDTLECEIDTFTGNKASCLSWGCFGDQGAKKSMEQHHDNATNTTSPPPSLDLQNSLQVGMWKASRDTWSLCVSVILTSRIKRLQQMLSSVGTESLVLADGANLAATASAGNAMAKDIRAKTEIVLGMVEIWTSKYTEC